MREQILLFSRSQKSPLVQQAGIGHGLGWAWLLLLPRGTEGIQEKPFQADSLPRGGQDKEEPRSGEQGPGASCSQPRWEPVGAGGSSGGNEAGK